ncbi:hydrogen peroxide-inducible genes activator [Psychrosphaera sp. B3R10]|uniref:hydrogen peroxide-inducible genes activator n=1 Tax=unclassified Psychrosphaera TaxID=2641570 RepID=UPI001C094A98|nr:MULTISPECIES: hydrogen peroxide-inducible genes activator [unclassified Psychrosphaera]MBU2881084.1 hydrogen peroxide-inducible genes activator [Psychrosphaera sp. I2R16]MBU2990008.1 hydrogen peroxide-inducible genes activator [Psychrosphaera sp. B3R10]MDO6721209.1 hydrogen peroxide-inducible genes activator [Psychrosphaera sp. 1_MG-2023]
MKLPKLQQLKYLVSLYDTGHFGQAAKKCFVSQSTLSSAIQALEEQLDAQLIERDHKTFVFTPVGVDVVKKSREILESSADLVATATSDGNQYGGELHLGIIPTIAPFVVNPLIKDCAEQFPKLDLYLREDTTDNCLSLLREGRLDMVLMATPYNVGEFVEYHLIKDQFYHVFHKDNVENNVYLLERDHCLSEHTISGCSLSESKDVHPFQASSLTTLLAMVEGHAGATYLTKLAIKSGFVDRHKLQVAELEDKNAFRNLSLVWRKTSHRRVFYSNIGVQIKRVLEQLVSS